MSMYSGTLQQQYAANALDQQQNQLSPDMLRISGGLLSGGAMPQQFQPMGGGGKSGGGQLQGPGQGMQQQPRPQPQQFQPMGAGGKPGGGGSSLAGMYPQNPRDGMNPQQAGPGMGAMTGMQQPQQQQPQQMPQQFQPRGAGGKSGGGQLQGLGQQMGGQPSTMAQGLGGGQSGGMGAMTPMQQPQQNNPLMPQGTQQNYDFLKQTQGMPLANAYLASQAGGNGFAAQGMDNYTANQFLGPENSVASGQKNIHDLTFGPGGTMMSGGQSYQLPVYGPMEQKMADPRAYLAANPFQQSAGAGTPAWWNAIKGG